MLNPRLTVLALAAFLLALVLAAAPAIGFAGDRPGATAAKKKGKKSRRDIDGDGIRNKRDRDIDGDRKRNRRDREMDGDGVKNARDRDIDADRLRNCPRDRDMDADRIRNKRDRDMDGDGRKNARDRDIDADGVPNRRDRDMDCDRLGARADKDIDGDGLLNYEDPDSDASGSRQTGEIPRGVRLPRTFFGLVADHVGSSSGSARAAYLDRIDSTGVRTIRQKFEWSRVERLPNVYDWRFYDRYVADLTRRGFQILPVLFDPPAWRSSRPAVGAARGTYPPRSDAEFAHFARLVVRRYGPRGAFWARNPRVPYRPLRSWQVWNEPHIKAYWATGQDPADYVRMLRAARNAIKGADPGAEVIAAGMSETNIGIPIDRYLRGMYRAGARGAFDTVAVHPYASAADLSYDIMRRTRRVMNRYGDGGTPIRVTELGWATWGSKRSPFNLGPHGQAVLVKRVWATLVAERNELKLKGLVYYNYRDIPRHGPDFQDYFGLHVGLLRIDGSPKPAYRSFVETVKAMSAR